MSNFLFFSIIFVGFICRGISRVDARLDPLEFHLVKKIPASIWKNRHDDPCHWPGITCSSTKPWSSIVGIELAGEEGRILESLLHFSRLESLEFTSSSSPPSPWYIPQQLGNLPGLRKISLRNNSFGGTIPASICGLKSLHRLDLSGNKLHGRIPSCIHRLKSADFRSMKFRRMEYPIRVLQDSPRKSRVLRSEENSRLWAILGSIIAFLAIVCGALIGTFLWWLRRVKKKTDKFNVVDQNAGCSDGNSAEGLLSTASQRQIAGLLNFEYEDLELATDKFSEARLIGKGAYGQVYHGTLVDGKEVAIKQLLQRTPTCKKWFLHELLVISSVRHRNLVPLIGCCIDQGFPLLVCEYMPNGNLQTALFGRDSSSSSSCNVKVPSAVLLSWSLRFRIAMDVARGLQYLHEDSLTGKIVHRDVKPANIVLDKDMNAHISDFGLAKLMDHDHGDKDQTREVIETSVVGTRGYLAPEYVLHGQLSEKVDIYSYGIVLLEIITGRRGVQTSNDPAIAEPISIDEWAWELLNSNRLEQLVDPRLGKCYQLDELVRMVQVAMWCTQSVPEMRPSMGQAMLMLSGQVGVPELPSVRLSWEEFKDFDTSSYGFSSSTIWASMNDASTMSGYETALGASLPDPKTHHEEEERRLGIQQIDLGSTDSSSSTTTYQVPVNSFEVLSGRGR